MQFVALDDPHFPGSGPREGSDQGRSLISSIGEDALDEGKETTRPVIENQQCAIAILHVGRMDDDIQEEAQGIDEDVPLAARDLLARIKALRVERGAPF